MTFVDRLVNALEARVRMLNVLRALQSAEQAMPQYPDRHYPHGPGRAFIALKDYDALRSYCLRLELEFARLVGDEPYGN